MPYPCRHGRSCAGAPPIVLVSCLLLALPAVASGPDPDCLRLPDDLVLMPGEWLHYGDLTFMIATDFVGDRYGDLLPGAEDGAGGAGAEGFRPGRLRIELVVGVTDPLTRSARRGSMVPGLEVRYSLGGSEGPLSTGTLDYHLSSHGPAYGAEIPVDEDPGGPLDLSLDISGSPRYGAGPEHHPEDPSDCLKAPSFLRSVVDLAALFDSHGGGEPGNDQPDVRSVLLGSLDPRPSDSYSDIWGHNDGVTYLAIMGSTNGTLFIDVTDPANPVEAGYIGGPSSSWRDIKTYTKGANAYAYIVTEGSGAGEGLQIVDITDPLNPTLVNTYNATFTTAHNVWIDTDRGELWGIGTDNGTRILDIATDPVNPTEIGSFTARYVHDAYVKDGLAYLSEINQGQHEIADSSDVSNVTTLSRWSTPGNATHNSWANDTHTLCATTDETSTGHVALYDVTDPSNPSDELGEYQPHPTASVHNAMFDDQDNEIVAMSYYALGWRYIDVHRPAAPIELAGYDTYPSGDTGFNGAWGVYTFDPRGYDYISDISTGLYVLDYQPTGGTLSGVVRDAVSGEPISAARVVVIANGTETFTRDDGVYAVYAEEGEILLRVSAWGYRTAIVNAGAMPLGGRVDADVELGRLPRVTLSGTVTSTLDGTPVAGATVRIAGTALATASAGDGSYQFDEVATGQQVVTAEAFGHASAEGRVVLAAGQGATLDLALEPGRFVDDVEADRGWQAGVAGDTATSGRWERVDPNGTGGGAVQPEDDHTPDPGVTAFITGQSPPGASNEANDVEGGVTTLRSPVVDVTGLGAAMLRYHRWVSANAGFLDPGGSLRVQISSDGGANWAQLENAGHANQWLQRQFDIGSFAGLTDQLRVQFRAEAVTSFSNYRILEAAVDDFEIVRACRARFNPGAGNADGDGSVDGCDACPLDPSDDADGDGRCGDADNAPLVANPGQEDADGDGVGDAADNCVADPNPYQRDLDRDGAGDACDADMDGDGLDDATDLDRDGDGVEDGVDLCPTVPDALQADDDGDGEGDACDTDDGLIQGLRVSGDRIAWESEQGSDSYNLYRGDLGAPGLLALAACRVAGLVTPYYEDPDLPPPGDGFLYLAARVAGGVEGSLGRRSDGGPRLVDEVCP